MTSVRFLFVSTLVLIVGTLLVQPVRVEAQCNVTMIMSFPTNAPATINKTKTLSAAASCMTTAMNAFFCFPGGAFFNTNMLYATAMSATVGPFCNWSCTCGVGAPPHVRITGADGLPVELMDFYIDEAADPQDTGILKTQDGTTEDESTS